MAPTRGLQLKGSTRASKPDGDTTGLCKLMELAVAWSLIGVRGIDVASSLCGGRSLLGKDSHRRLRIQNDDTTTR